MTGDEIRAILEGDEELAKRIRLFLIYNKYAGEIDGDGLVFLERTYGPEPLPAPYQSGTTIMKMNTESSVGKKEEGLKPPHFAFISYGRKEDEIVLVTKLKNDLLKSTDPACPTHLVSEAFLDLDNIGGAEVFDKRIEDKIEDSTVFLAVISPHAVRKESICRDETVYAYNHRKPIVPLMFKFNKESKLPLLLCRRNWIDFSQDYAKAFSSLCRYLAGDSTAANPPLHPIILDREPLDFSSEIARYSDNFSERPWIDGKISDWIQYSSTSGFVIVGNPGSGKSAISAWLSHSFQDQVIGIHICSSSNPRSLDQMELVGNLVTQLYNEVPEYAEITKTVKRSKVYDNATRAFRELIIEPLSSIKNPDLTLHTPKIIIVDALDEAFTVHRDNIVTLLLQQIDYLPPWLRIIATTRPEQGIIDLMGPRFSLLDLSAGENQGNNDEDIGHYIDSIMKKEWFCKRYGNSFAGARLFREALVRQSAGIFLYAVYVIKAIMDGDMDPRKPEMFPKNLVSFYQGLFQKKFPTDADYFHAKKVLGVLIAAKEPLSSAELAEFLEEDPSEIESALRPISALFTLNAHLHYRLFHNSLREWLSAKDSRFRVNLMEGNQIITDHCWREFENGVQEMSPYAVAYLPVHLLEAKRYKDLVQLLKNPKFFVRSWNDNEFTVKYAWAGIEKNSDIRMIDAYEDVIKIPSGYPDDFVMKISEFLTDTGYYTESILLLEYALKLCIRQLNEEKMVFCLSSLAWALYIVGQRKRSYELLNLHEFICRNRDDLYDLQIGTGYMANLASDLTSIDLNNQQEHYCRILGEKGKYWAGKSVGNLGLTLMNLKLTELAYRYFQQKKEISREIGDLQGLQWAYGYEAGYYETKGDSKRALELFARQYETAQSISYTRGMINSLDSQKRLYDSQGDLAGIARVEHCRANLNDTVAATGITILDSNDELFDELDRVCTAKEQEYDGDDRELIGILPYRAFLLSRKNDYTAALEIWKKQEGMAAALKIPVALNTARRNMWQVYCRQEDLQNVLSIPEKYPEVFTAIWAKYDLLNFLDSLIAFLSNKGETAMVEAALDFQINFIILNQESLPEPNQRGMQEADAESNKNSDYRENRLIIPLKSFLEQIWRSGENRDTQRIAWLVSHKTEFDIVIQYMAINNLFPDPVKNVIEHTKILAQALYSLGDFTRSYALYDSLNGYYTVTGDRNAAEKTLGEMGLNKEALGEFTPALTHYSEQAKICKEASFPEDYAWALSNKGDIFRKLGQLDDALESYREVEKVSEEKAISYWLLRAGENIGDIYKDYGEYVAAVKQFEKVLISNDTRTHPEISCRCLENQADIWYRNGNLRKARDAYVQVIGQLMMSPLELFDQWRILTKCAVLCDTLDEQEQYHDLLKKKQKLVAQIDTKKLLAYILTNQDHFHDIRFDLDLFYEWYEKRHISWAPSRRDSLSGDTPAQPVDTSRESELISQEEADLIRKSGDLCREYRFSMGIQYFQGFEGICELLKGEDMAARALFVSQREQCRIIGYREGQNIALGRIADTFLRERDMPHALTFTEEQATLASDLKALESVIRCGQRMADIHLSYGDYEHARKDLETVLESAEKSGSYHQILLSCYKMARINKICNSPKQIANYCRILGECAHTSEDRYFKDLATITETEILGNNPN